MDHGLELGDGAVGQGLPQVQNLDHSQAAQVLRRPGLPQLLCLSNGSPKNSTCNKVLKTLCILTGRIRLWRACAYSFEGEQLYLIVLAFKKPLDVLQDRGSSFQIPAGSLAHYSRPTDTGVSSVASSNATSYNHNVYAGIHTSCEVGVVALGPAGLALQPLKRPVGVCEAQLNHAAPT